MSDKYPSTSPYTYCGNNPVRLVDPNGREINVSAIYQRNKDGSYKYKTVVRAFEFFAKTSYGKKFLGYYAKKGQTIAGHTYQEDGKYHKKGIDLSFVSNDSDLQKIAASGTASESIVNGRLKTEINLSNTSELTGGAGNVLEALCHELFIHTFQSTQDFIDDKKLNNSQLNRALRSYIKDCSINTLQHKQDIDYNNMMLYRAIPIMQSYFDGSSDSRPKLSVRQIKDKINQGFNGLRLP